jgi:peptidoglycan hydrolase-like protein with peptidoglycan-binding domain
VQRALNAATDARLTVTGVFDRATTRAVTRYQRGVDLPRTGVVAPDTWDALRSGRV